MGGLVHVEDADGFGDEPVDAEAVDDDDEFGEGECALCGDTLEDWNTYPDDDSYCDHCGNLMFDDDD